MNSMLSDSIVALTLSSMLLIIVLSVNPVLIFENSFNKFRKVKSIEQEINDLFKHGVFGKLANYLEFKSVKPEIYLDEIYRRVRSKGVIGLRLLMKGKVIYTRGCTDHGWIIRIVIPSHEGIYLLELFIYCD